MTFLRSYSKLAGLGLQMERPLFVFRPKIHYFHHVLLEMRHFASQGYKCLNPISYSCSQAEDFIGRTSLISRRVAATHSERRVLQRYLAGVFDVWSKEREKSDNTSL